jgi:hypothetical protein
LLLVASVRGLQWWHSSSWSIGNPDTVVWTDARTMRRARAVRVAKLAIAFAIAALVGGAVALGVCDLPPGEAASPHGIVG